MFFLDNASEGTQQAFNAVEEVKTMVNGVDFTQIGQVYLAVVAGTIGTVVAIIAIKKGVNWLKSTIKRA